VLKLHIHPRFWIKSAEDVIKYLMRTFAGRHGWKREFFDAIAGVRFYGFRFGGGGGGGGSVAGRGSGSGSGGVEVGGDLS
jgi:hypothetical protein